MTFVSEIKDEALPKRVHEMICFGLYSASGAMNRAYGPMLSRLGLTYPQYIALTVLWERDGQTVGAMCRALRSDTSTVTPLLKRLEAAGLVVRRRGTEDERQVFVYLTARGRALQDYAPDITRCIFEDTGLSKEELDDLLQKLTVLRDNLLKSAQAG